MIELYQFPISHFCEKVRWALDHKKLHYRTINLLPGMHIKKTVGLVGRSSVPVIVDDGHAIGGSSDIITYLDVKYPNESLTPEDAGHKRAALEWENYIDEEFGIAVRCLCYHTLLEHPAIVTPFFTKGGPWYGPLLMKVIFPKVRIKMRKFMKINEASAKQSKDRIDSALGKILKHLENNTYMVGDQFSRVDIAVAALLAPMFMPDGYGLDFPQEYPEPLNGIIASYGDKFDWVREIYSKHR